MLANQPCWFDKPRCGKPCGKRLKCGTHVCKQICHRGPCEDAAVPGQRCSQTCGKLREACGHEDQDPCHAPLDCKDDKPCQADKWLTCECQRRKQKAKCLSTRSEPKGPPGREGPKCDDECLRQKRNRQLAEALNLDPDAHTDGHIPYRDATLSFFRDHTEWATKQEGRVREFAESPARYLRFEPMKPAQRLFLHMLAQDFGVESGSEDPEPHRFVTLHKGASFVAAPHKTLLQAFRQWKKAQKTSANSSRPASPPPPSTTTDAASYNALLLTRARFGLTGEEVDAALSSELGAASAGANNNNNSLAFTTSFLPSSEEVFIRATAKTTIASIASGAVGPAQVESLLVALKPKVAKAVAAKNLAAGVVLCHASSANDDDADIVITRREGTGNGSSSSSSGWNTVASRAAARPRTWGAAASSPAAVVDNNSHKSNGFVALRKLGTLTKKKTPLPPQSQSQSQPSAALISTTTEATSASVEPTAATTSTTMATTDGGGGDDGDDSVAEAATTTAPAAAVAGEEEEKE